MSSLAQLRTATRRLVFEEDNTNTHFSDSELNDYLNLATQFLGTQMEWAILTATAVAVAGQALYSLPADFIALVDCYFDNTKLVTLERDDLSGQSTSWQNVPATTPSAVYKADQSTIGLYPPPDATQDGKLIQIQYIQLPATLANDSDVPNLHLAFQMCLPFYAAFLCEHKLGNEKKADANLLRYDQHRKALMSRLQRFSDELFRFRWSSQYPERRSW